MSFRVEHIFVQRQQVIVREYQVQILERLGEKKALLDVVEHPLVDVSEASVAIFSAAIGINGHGSLPRPLAVSLILRESPHVKVGLDRFRSKNVHFVFHSHSIVVVERERFGPKMRACDRVRMMACFGQLERQILKRRTMFRNIERRQCKKTARKTRQMVHATIEFIV